MLFLTHILFALLIGILLIKYFFVSNILFNKIIFLLFVFIGAVIPDIDNPKSKVGKKLPVVSHIIKFTLGHRSYIHSAWFLIIISYIFYFFYNVAGYGLFVGYASHLVLDSFTRHGVYWLYPIKSFKIHGPIKTGSMLEKVFLVIISILLIYSLKYIL